MGSLGVTSICPLRLCWSENSFLSWGMPCGQGEPCFAYLSHERLLTRKGTTTNRHSSPRKAFSNLKQPCPWLSQVLCAFPYVPNSFSCFPPRPPALIPDNALLVRLERKSHKLLGANHGFRGVWSRDNLDVSASLERQVENPNRLLTTRFMPFLTYLPLGKSSQSPSRLPPYL